MRNLQKKLMFFLFICIILQITYTTPVYSLCKLCKNNSINNFESIVSNNQLISKHAIQIILIMAIICVILIFYIIYDKLNFKIKLQRIAYTDNLTGANTIDKFVIDANKILCKNTQVKYALLYIDIDKFKYINEMFGYAEGNKILIHISQVLNNNTNKYEICARMDNDHFILLIACNTEDELLNRLSKINKEICNLNTTNSSKYKIVMSSGIYKITKKDDIKKIDLLIDRANIAAKSKKEKYEHSYSFFNEDTRNRLYKEKRLEDNMNKALEKGEFIVYYQPKYSLDDVNEIEGAEALIRWNSPEFGFISPIDFVPLFEKNGFIVNIDFYVFEEVCKKIREWMDEGQKVVPISVNLSRMHFVNSNFIEKFKLIVDKYKIPTRLIELELTETAVLDNIEGLLDTMNNLKEKGFVISMDDFGTGYSSLNLLKELPVDILKLDRAFFTEKDESNNEKIVISNVIKMAKELKMKVISEGVETISQVEFLKQIGCDMVQGYLFSKPMPVKEFEKIAFKKE